MQNGSLNLFSFLYFICGAAKQSAKLCSSYNHIEIWDVVGATQRESAKRRREREHEENFSITKHFVYAEIKEKTFLHSTQAAAQSVLTQNVHRVQTEICSHKYLFVS